MTGRISYRKENQLVLPLRLFKRFRSPGIPVHGIVGVLKEVRGFLMDQTVGFFHGSTPSPKQLVNISISKKAGFHGTPASKEKGRGMEFLRKNGIEVSAGYLEKILKEDLKEFLERVKSGKQHKS
jgi:hypothetical protein